MEKEEIHKLSTAAKWRAFRAERIYLQGVGLFPALRMKKDQECNQF